MEEKEESRPPKGGKGLQISVGEINFDQEVKRDSSLHLSPRGGAHAAKPSNGRWNCLCSPTTHAGSFRCRYHRASAGMLRASGSVGSNLSMLGATKSDDF